MSTPEKTKKAKTDKLPAMPEGFEELKTSLAGWFLRRPMNSIQGIYRGHFLVDGFKKGEKKKVFRIEIKEGKTLISNKETDEAEITEGIVGLDETGWTAKLGDLEEGREVFVRYIKKDGEGKNDPHIFQVGVVPF